MRKTPSKYILNKKNINFTEFFIVLSKNIKNIIILYYNNKNIMTQINIIYYTYINHNINYKVIIEGQLDDIIRSNISNNSKLYIVIACEIINILHEAKNFIDQKLLYKNINYELTIENKNLFEYYGIKKVYDLAKLEPEKYFVYIHGKGMFNNFDDPHPRTKSNIVLTGIHIYQWERILNIFQNDSDIKIATMFPHGAWAWFNFWWASGKYLCTCEDPKITFDNRYYYESWLGTGHLDNSKTYNLLENNYQTYTPDEANNSLNDYIKKIYT